MTEKLLSYLENLLMLILNEQWVKIMRPAKKGGDWL